MKKKTKLTVLIVVLISITAAFGQAMPASLPPPPPPGFAPGLPIDSGVAYLLIAGIYLGIKKRRKN